MTREPIPLLAALERHLNMYSLAASAAGVSMLALAQSAQARIVYTKTYQHLPVNKAFLLDLNHDGIADFKLYYRSYHGWFLHVYRFQSNRNEVWGTLSTGRNAVSALPGGVRIRADKRFGTDSFMAGCPSASGYSCKVGIGPWYNVKNRYLGLKFVIKGKFHYGWARLSVGTKRHPNPVLTGYAYETIPNKAIITGKTRGPDAVTLQTASLGHLARGASAMSALRVEQTAATTH
jgi:hypothetical protein